MKKSIKNLLLLLFLTSLYYQQTYSMSQDAGTWTTPHIITLTVLGISAITNGALLLALVVDNVEHVKHHKNLARHMQTLADRQIAQNQSLIDHNRRIYTKLEELIAAQKEQIEEQNKWAARELLEIMTTKTALEKNFACRLQKLEESQARGLALLLEPVSHLKNDLDHIKRRADMATK